MRIAGQSAHELEPYWIEARGKERSPLTRNSPRATGFSLLSVLVRWLPTRTDFQFSRVWLTIPTNEDLGNTAVQTASRGPTSMRATSCPSTISATAPDLSPTMPFVAGGLTTTMAHYRTGGTPRFVAIGRRSRLRRALRLAERCPPAWLPILSEGAEPADSRNKSW
jgi:hypothetical protein